MAQVCSDLMTSSCADLYDNNTQLFTYELLSWHVLAIRHSWMPYMAQVCSDLMTSSCADLYDNNTQLFLLVPPQGIVAQRGESCLSWFPLLCDLTLLITISMHMKYLCINKS